MGASFSTSRKRKASESVPPTPQPQQKKHKVAKPGVVDDYQVFLSFRGPDTRNGFTDVLYDHMDRVGIRVFRDEDEISVGQRIDIILQAIENSEICVPILSESFASSAWCLREVEKMVELEKKVMPIFCKISPYDVKLKTDLYKTAMAEHEAKHGKNQVEKWKDALKKVAKIKGREVSANTSYTEFCKMFVNDVLGELLPRKRCDTDHLVGMDDKIERMMTLLDIGSDDRKFVVIHGMSGIGKTTLANVIFDKLSSKFDNSCFLEDVRESFCRGSNGFTDLQKLLLERLDPKSVGRSNLSINIRERFCKRKVLIILDDVDKWEQIEKLAGKSNWFGAGSRIIITTRNKDVLNEGALDEDEVRYFEMETLDHEESFALFCLYAFRNHAPPVGFESFSREIIQGAGGLPLSLRVTGALLYRKDVKVWRDVISRLKKTPFKEVVERLRISFDALEDDQKKIFLDIACLSSVGKEKAKAVYMWEACELYPHYGLGVLSSMSLVKINVGENRIWMHDQLRDLGKKIVREENGNPTKRSRLWEHKEALNVLMSTTEGKEKVEALSIDNATDITLSSEHFASFRELRFLKMVGANIIGDFENLLPSLRWFSWHLCSPIMGATNLYMQNLVILDLSFSFINESWGGWSLIQILNNLKVLDLSNCNNLTRTPDFSQTNCLERLVLRGCSELREIHGSIGKLMWLKYLNLTDCYSLGGLPYEIGSLVNLEELQVSDWSFKSNGAFNLPSSIGHLESLTVLELEDLEIIDVPESIGGLVKLKHLSLRGCLKIKVLPESLGHLKSLTELKLSGTSISELPNSLGRLVKLKSLELCECSNLEVLPESLGELESLTELDLSNTRIRELPNSVGQLVRLERMFLKGCCNLEVLPDSIGSLQELKVLQMGDCKFRKIPSSIGMMEKLEDLYISNAKMLEEVPMEIGNLSSLNWLTLTGSLISMLPSTISELTILEELDLGGNKQLQELPNLPLSLRTLHVSSRSSSLKTSDLSRLTNLTRLELLDIDDYRRPPSQLMPPSSKFEGVDKLTKLRRLYMDLALATTLPSDLGSLTLLEELSLDFQNCVSLLDISSSTRLEMKLPDLSSLKNLYAVSFYNCLMKDGELESLGIQLSAWEVTNVYLRNCGAELIERICVLKNLWRLTIHDCESLKTLPDLSELKNLDFLEVRGCKELVEIPGLGNLESLTTLDISKCGSLEMLEDLSKLENLSHIVLIDCPKLRSIEGADGLLFSILVIGNCRSIRNAVELKKRSKEGSINGVKFENFG